MTDLSTSNLKRLLDQATPGPWHVWDAYEDEEYRPDTALQLHGVDGEYLGIMHGQDAHLAAAAPDLAQEVLRMREELRELRDQLKKRSEHYSKVELSTDPLDGIQLEDNYAEDEISRILGDHDD